METGIERRQVGKRYKWNKKIQRKNIYGDSTRIKKKSIQEEKMYGNRIYIKIKYKETKHKKRGDIYRERAKKEKTNMEMRHKQR